MTSEDLNRTYHHTFLGYVQDDEIKPFFIRDCVNNNELRGDVEGDMVEVDINSPNVVLRFPDSGVYAVTPNRCAYVSRRASRQWRRGILERELTITGDVSFGDSLVRAMFNPAYQSYNEVVQRSERSDFRSAALSRNWWVRKKDDAEYPLIYFRNRPVGEITGDGPVFNNDVMKKLFEEEV